jgi:hypothetical protein
MKQTVIGDFLLQIIKRLTLESPKFFKVFQIIGIVASLITGIPEFLELIGVHLPQSIAFFANKTIAIAGSVVVFMATLTVKNPNEILKNENTTNSPLATNSFMQCPKEN